DRRVGDRPDVVPRPVVDPILPVTRVGYVDDVEIECRDRHVAGLGPRQFVGALTRARQHPSEWRDIETVGPLAHPPRAQALPLVAPQRPKAFLGRMLTGRADR